MTLPRLLSPAALIILAFVVGCGSSKPEPADKTGPNKPDDAPAAKGYPTPEEAWKAAADGFVKNDFERGISAFTRAEQYERLTEQVFGVPDMERWVMDAMTKNAGEGAFKGKAGPGDKGPRPIGEKEKAALAPYVKILADHGVTEKAVTEFGAKDGGPRSPGAMFAALVKDPAACFVAVSKKIYENDKTPREVNEAMYKLEDMRIEGDKASARAAAGGPPGRLLFEKTPSGGWLISGNEMGPDRGSDKSGPREKDKSVPKE